MFARLFRQSEMNSKKDCFTGIIDNDSSSQKEISVLIDITSICFKQDFGWIYVVVYLFVTTLAETQIPRYPKLSRVIWLFYACVYKKMTHAKHVFAFTLYKNFNHARARPLEHAGSTWAQTWLDAA